MEALLLKATALLELRKTHEAIMHFQAAMRWAPHRFEAYKGMFTLLSTIIFFIHPFFEGKNSEQ